MKTISINDYHESMGLLIDVRNPLDYAKKHDSRSINIYADKLIFNHSQYLTKTKTYYIVCEKGFLSRKVITILSQYGYNLVQVKL